MKKFLQHTLVFIGIFWILNLIPHAFLSPYFGNKWYTVKYRHFAKNQEQFNAVIWGSSRIDRHADPGALSAALQDHQVSFFNIGCPGTYSPEELYLYEMFLGSLEQHPIDYAFLELQPLREPGGPNQFTWKGLYWMNLDYCVFSTRAVLDARFRVHRKGTAILTVGITYAKRFLSGWKALFFRYQELPGRAMLGRNGDGFYPLDDALADREGTDTSLANRQAEFLADTTVLDERRLLADAAFSGKVRPYLNEAYLGKLLALIEASDKQGVHLVYIIPPRLARYGELVALKDRLPPRHIIELADPRKYPELYQVDYSFDVGHLNKKGAAVFTRYLVQQLKRTVFPDKSETRVPGEVTRQVTDAGGGQE